MNSSKKFCYLVLVAAFALHPRGFADEFPQGVPKSDDRLVATVEGKPIYERQVRRQIKQVFKDRPIDPQAKPYIEAQTLEQLIKRHLILSYLDANNAGASEQDLDLALQRVEKQLGAQNVTLDQHLAKIGLSQGEFREALSWQIGWQRFLDRYLTDENLERYFNQNRKQFDGTQLRVAQILLKVEPTEDPDKWAAAHKQATEIRNELKDEKISFAEAARKYSQSPSGKNGGDIGFISRNKPMPEGFSRAAFELQAGGISQPVRSKFGIHLIQCVEVKPGDIKWTDVKLELASAVTQYLFDWVSDQRRQQTKIEFVPDFPHFRAGTSELAE